MASIPRMDSINLSALEISVLLSTFLFAVSACQLFIYWRSRFKDPRYIWYMLGVIGILEILHSVLFWMYLYRMTVTFYGDLDELTRPHWSLNVSLAVSGFLTSMVQSYYAYRVYVLSSHRRFIPVISWILTVVKFAGTVVAAVLDQDSASGKALTTDAMTTLALDVAIDVINTASLCYLLITMKSGMKRTDHMLTWICRWTLETGIATAVVALAAMITCIIIPQTSIFLTLIAFYAKLYSNSLMASLNSRGPFGPGSISRREDDRHISLQIRTTQERVEARSYSIPTTSVRMQGTLSSGQAQSTKDITDQRAPRVEEDTPNQRKDPLASSGIFGINVDMNADDSPAFDVKGRSEEV